MRVFVAIDIGERMRGLIEDLQRKLIGEATADGMDHRHARWVRPEAMHLTLKFLGNVADGAVPSVCEAVAEVAGRHRPFELELAGVGWFGGKAARVLWVGAGDGGESLRLLQGDLEGRLARDGWPADVRHFTGHLTLCRVKNQRAAAKIAEIAGRYRQSRLGCIGVEAVNVYSSLLRPEGAEYTVLACCSLSGVR